MPTSEPVLRVLCVDDNHDIADTLGVLLDLVGFEARVCYDGVSALIAAEEFRPDAAIIDLMMPGMDGVELGRRLRARPWAAGLPLVAVTALGDEEARRRTTEAGFDLHLTKPVEPDRLANVLADLVIMRGDSVERPLPARAAEAFGRPAPPG
jgi:DNA-binding response OmpR family regulator